MAEGVRCVRTEDGERLASVSSECGIAFIHKKKISTRISIKYEKIPKQGCVSNDLGFLDIFEKQ